MKGKDTYIENGIQNTFTAYLVKAIHGARQGYLIKRNKISVHENYIEDIPNVLSHNGLKEHMYIEDIQPGEFSDLENHKLYKAVMWLKDSEREIIYRHIFEEKSFSQIALELQLSESVIKGHYYYALTKIRNRMRGEEV